MKYILQYVLFLMLTSCGQNQTSIPKDTVKSETKDTTTDQVPNNAGQHSVVIDTKESVVTWKGSMLMGSNSHEGYVYASKGELMINSGQVVGGTVEVDMNTIGEKTYGSNNEMVNHFKSPDFFDVKKFPFSTIVITKVASINAADKEITGNLTIKGITHPVTFPAKMEVKDSIVKANGRLVIDRTKWDVRYESGKFYDVFADKTISDSIEFNIKIVAKNRH